MRGNDEIRIPNDELKNVFPFVIRHSNFVIPPVLIHDSRQVFQGLTSIHLAATLRANACSDLIHRRKFDSPSRF